MKITEHHRNMEMSLADWLKENTALLDLCAKLLAWDPRNIKEAHAPWEMHRHLRPLYS